MRLDCDLDFAVFPIRFRITCVDDDVGFATFLDQFVVSYRHPVIDFLAADGSGYAVGLVLVSAVVAAPIAEEFFFRKVLQGWLETRLGDRAVVVSAVAFGLAHFGHGLGWVPLIGFGLATGYLARQRGTIVPCIVVHALFNSVSVGLLLLARPGVPVGLPAPAVRNAHPGASAHRRIIWRYLKLSDQPGLPRCSFARLHPDLENRILEASLPLRL